MNSHIFDPELEQIVNLDLRQKVRDVLETADSRHETEPASSTGKYHPDFAHGIGGLVRHTKAVVLIASELCNTRCFDKDCIIAAALLHDMHKYNGPSMYTCHEHPFLMAQDAARGNLPAAVVCAIESHMGQWNANRRSTIVLPLPSDEFQWLVHYADYLASRTWLKLTFDENNNLVV